MSKIDGNRRPIRLAILFDVKNTGGGGYQQALNSVLLVKKLSSDLVNPIFFTHELENIDFLGEHNIEAQYISRTLIRRVLSVFRQLITHPRILNWWSRVFGLNYFEKKLVNNKIDLAYFLSSTPIACELEQINYMTTVWDLSHRDFVEFPEVSNGRIFERREKTYRALLPKATAIIADSALGKENIIRRYGIDENRIYIMPFSAANVIMESKNHIDNVNIQDKYQLKTPYVYYPAQFWSHKNHVYLLQGLKFLENEFNKKISVIFTGRDKGNLKYVQKISDELKLTERVRFAGFVSDNELETLYKQSLALVMPTYFGPTNIPPLEAFTLGVPVLYSNIEGLVDQVGDAAMLIDLDDPMSMAIQLNELIDNNKLRDSLISNGYSLINELTDEKRLKVLEDILRQYQTRRFSWE